MNHFLLPFVIFVAVMLIGSLIGMSLEEDRLPPGAPLTATGWNVLFRISLAMFVTLQLGFMIVAALR